MEILHSLFAGFQVALIPANLFFCFIGVVIGTLVGVLPGIGPVGAMALLLPATFGLSLAQSVIMLAGIYYGAMYGGSTTSILVNIPGEAASVVTCMDGYQMARRGRAGPALGISAMGSFVGGTLSIIGLMIVAKPLASLDELARRRIWQGQGDRYAMADVSNERCGPDDGASKRFLSLLSREDSTGNRPLPK